MLTFWTSSLQNCEKIYSCSLCCPLCGALLWQPQKMCTRTNYVLVTGSVTLYQTLSPTPRQGKELCKKADYSALDDKPTLTEICTGSHERPLKKSWAIPVNLFHRIPRRKLWVLFYFVCLFFLFVCFCHAHGMQKFPRHGSNLSTAVSWTTAVTPGP